MHVQISRTGRRVLAAAGILCVALITASCSATGIFPWAMDRERGSVMDNQAGSGIPLPPSVHDFDRNEPAGTPPPEGASSAENN